MPDDKTNQCEMCDFTDESRLSLVEHVREDHTAQERLNALINRVPKPEEAVNAS